MRPAAAKKRSYVDMFNCGDDLADEEGNRAAAAADSGSDWDVSDDEMAAAKRQKKSQAAVKQQKTNPAGTAANFAKGGKASARNGYSQQDKATAATSSGRKPGSKRSAACAAGEDVPAESGDVIVVDDVDDGSADGVACKSQRRAENGAAGQRRHSAAVPAGLKSSRREQPADAARAGADDSEDAEVGPQRNCFCSIYVVLVLHEPNHILQPALSCQLHVTHLWLV
jgi:hypothetical protein